MAEQTVSLEPLSLDAVVRNSEPAGQSVIEGTAAIGEKLTVSNESISDDDGLGSFSYQWLKDGSAINGAIASTYTLTQADVGKAITVSVSYTDGQGTAESLTSVATASVSSVNDAPNLTTSAALSTDEDTASSAIAFSATDVDGDTLTYSFSPPSKGSVTNNGNGTYTFTPAAHENGSDSFTVTVNDGTDSVSQTVDVTINAVNDAPVLTISATLSTDEDTASSAIAFSATDVDGDNLTYSFSNPSKGSVTNNGNGTYTYTPAAGENGSDSFTLTVNDGTADVSQSIDVVIIEKTFAVTLGSASTGFGNRYFIDGGEAPELILEPGHIYKFDLSHSSTANHPLNFDLSGLNFNVEIITTGTRGSDQIITVTVPDDASGAIDYLCDLPAAMDKTANFKFAQAITIGHTDSGVTRTLFGDQSLIFVSSETNTNTVAMSSGSLAILSEDLSFTHVELNTANYDHGISISDVVLQLRDIVGLSTLDGKQKIAADIDGDGEVAISDVVSNLRNIVGLDTIEECALVDSTDALVTSLNSSTIADLTLVQYGDVDLSATFLIA